jgi:hypothetical protein
MPSVFLTDFKFGMDRTRKRIAGVPGTLWIGKNIVISRGGDIERARRFVPTYTLPAGTFGLGAVRGQLWVFGSGAAPGGLPTGIQYQQLVSPDASAMTGVLDVKTVSGKLYVIARYASGHTYHFYNGARVTDWDALANANTDMPTLADYMAELINADPAVSAVPSGSVVTLTANVAGTAFTISKSTVNGGAVNDQDITLSTVQANVAAVAEVRATATVTVTGGSFLAGLNQVVGITANSVQLMKAVVDWTSSNAATASAVAAQINNLSSTHGYAAVAVGAVITITAGPGTGTTPNGFVVAVTNGGNVTTTKTNFSGGVAAVAPIAQIVTATFSGTFEAADQFTITINGTAYTSTGRAAGTGVSALVFKRRVWSCAGSLEEYSSLNTFNNWNNANASSGSGFLNVSNEAEGSERLVGAGVYAGQMAIFSRRNIRIYDINTDATQIAFSKALDNSGTMATRSILNFGDTDLMYLDEPGLRSIRAREYTNLPFVNDLGTAIAPFVKDYMDTLSRGTLQRACAVVEPREGRYMLALGAFVFVLSYFPASQISAWTYFDPGFSISDFARAYNNLYARSGNSIYLYGGVTGTTYPNANEMIASVQLPFISAQPPGRETFSGFDISCTGTWNVVLLPDPNNENAEVAVGNISKTTYPLQDILAQMRTTHVAVNLTCASAGASTIQNLALHFKGGEKSG